MGWFQNKQNVITVQILGTPFQLMEICFQRWAIYKTVEILTLQKLPLLHLNFMIILLFQLSDQQFCGTKIFVCTWKKMYKEKSRRGINVHSMWGIDRDFAWKIETLDLDLFHVVIDHQILNFDRAYFSGEDDDDDHKNDNQK